MWNANTKIAFGFVLGFVACLGLVPILFGANFDDLSGLVSAYAALLLVLLTAVYALFTWRIVEEARRTREDSVRPHVVVTLEPARFPGFIDIVIENIGTGAAYQHKVSFEPKINFVRKNESRNLEELRILSIPIIKKGQSFRYFVSKFEDISPKTATAQISFSDQNGRSFDLLNEVNISVFEGMSRLGQDDIRSIARSVERISNFVDRCAFGGRIDVNVYTEVDRESERKALEGEWENQDK